MLEDLFSWLVFYCILDLFFKCLMFHVYWSTLISLTYVTLFKCFVYSLVIVDCVFLEFSWRNIVRMWLQDEWFTSTREGVFPEPAKQRCGCRRNKAKEEDMLCLSGYKEAKRWVHCRKRWICLHEMDRSSSYVSSVRGFQSLRIV